MTLSTDTPDVVEAIIKVVQELPEDRRTAVLERFAEAATAFHEGRLAMDEFVRRIIPANLFTAEEREILEAKGAYPQYGKSLN